MSLTTRVLWAALLVGAAGAPADCIEALQDQEPGRFNVAGDPVVLVDDNRARATLVVVPGGNEPGGDRAAAELLAEWIELITDVRLRIVEEPVPRMVPVYVGAAAVEAGLRVSGIRSDSGEGIRVRVEPERVLIAGQSGAATIKAAAAFLEQLGCRWYIDGELGRHYPESDTLRVQPVDLVDRPGLAMRRIWSGDGWTGNTAWKQWNGAGGIGYVFGHDWRLFDEADFDRHPDWFALDDDGERVRGPWLNTGNRELRQAFAQRLGAQLQPGRHASISPPDRIRPDHSPQSARLDVAGAVEPMAQRLSMSDRFFDFANDIAGRVAPTHPGSMLGFYAYSDYGQPPVRIDRLAPNLCVWIAPFRYSRYHRIGDPLSPSRSRLADEIERWRQIASCLGYRTYNYNLSEAMTPFAKLRTWSHDIPYLAERGFVGISIEAFPSWDLSAPALYLATRLAYSPQRPAAEILADFYRGFYGPAAGPMRRYWEVVDDGWSTLRTESGSIYAVHRVFTDERMQRLDKALDDAERSSQYDSLRSRRVALARSGYLHAQDFVAVQRSLHSGDVPAAMATYGEWLERAEDASRSGLGHTYTVRYMELFIGRYVRALAEALEGAPPASRVDVLPDQMEMVYERELLTSALTGWKRVRTRGATLEQQGIPERFEVMWYRTSFDLPAGASARLLTTAIDGTFNVAVNGRMLAAATAADADADADAEAGAETEPGSAAQFGALTPHDIDITQLVREGRNELMLRVDHRTFRRLKLGGIVGPVYVLHSPTGS